MAAGALLEQSNGFSIWKVLLSGIVDTPRVTAPDAGRVAVNDLPSRLLLPVCPDNITGVPFPPTETALHGGSISGHMHL